MSNTQNKNVEEERKRQSAEAAARIKKERENLLAMAAVRVAHVRQVAESELTRLIIKEGCERAVDMNVSQDSGRPPSWVTIRIHGQFIVMPPTATDEEIECAVGNLFDLFVKLSRD